MRRAAFVGWSLADPGPPGASLDSVSRVAVTMSAVAVKPGRSAAGGSCRRTTTLKSLPSWFWLLPELLARIGLWPISVPETITAGGTARQEDHSTVQGVVGRSGGAASGSGTSGDGSVSGPASRTTGLRHSGSS